MKTLLLRLLWFSYFCYDYLSCIPSFKRIRDIDSKLSIKLSNYLRANKTKTNIVIFACYEKDLKDDYINYFISKLKDCQLIIINNSNENKPSISEVGKRVVWINRPNFSRDIGAYRLGISACKRSKLKPSDTITLTNDSFFVLKDSFFDFLVSPLQSEVIGHSFSSSPEPHIRSYCLRFNPKILDKLAIYLARIKPLRSRYSAIIQGEIGMSKNVLLKRDFRIRLLHSPVESIKKQRINNTSGDFILDPYEISQTTTTYMPEIIKREVVEKGLAKSKLVASMVSQSSLPNNVKNSILHRMLIDKTKKNLAYRFKRFIGEI